MKLTVQYLVVAYAQIVVLYLSVCSSSTYLTVTNPLPCLSQVYYLSGSPWHKQENKMFGLSYNNYFSQCLRYWDSFSVCSGPSQALTVVNHVECMANRVFHSKWYASMDIVTCSWFPTHAVQPLFRALSWQCMQQRTQSTCFGFGRVSAPEYWINAVCCRRTVYFTAYWMNIVLLPWHKANFVCT